MSEDLEQAIQKIAENCIEMAKEIVALKEEVKELKQYRQATKIPGSQSIGTWECHRCGTVHSITSRTCFCDPPAKTITTNGK